MVPASIVSRWLALRALAAQYVTDHHRRGGRGRTVHVRPDNVPLVLGAFDGAYVVRPSDSPGCHVCGAPGYSGVMARVYVPVSGNQFHGWVVEARAAGVVK